MPSLPAPSSAEAAPELRYLLKSNAGLACRVCGSRTPVRLRLVPTEGIRVTTPASPATGGNEARPPRRRKPLRRAEVVSVSRITPRLVSVLVSGEGLEVFADAAPTSHLKVFLPAPGQDAPLLPEFLPEGQVLPDDARPSVRTYTPRRFDAATGPLEIQFVLHGAGPASEWAERASAGDKLAVAGPGGRFVMDNDAERWWIAGDESAIPAVATLLEAL